MKETLELIHKYGVSAILFIWLSVLQVQFNNAQGRLFDCYDERIEEFRFADDQDQSLRWYAILPKEPKIKKS